MNGTAPLHVELSLNGQESTAGGPILARYAPPSAEVISPASGPSAGETVVHVHGLHSSSVQGCDLRCKFAHEAIVPAESTLDGGYSVHCVAPLGVRSGMLAISLNGQQYSDGPAHFEAFSPFSPSSVEPPLGPSSGGTVILVRAANLTADATFADVDARCRFSATDENGTAVAASGRHLSATSSLDVAASRVSTSKGGALQCLVPRQVGGALLQVTLNGQQFSSALQYSVISPTRVSRVYPLSTPESGGIVITVHGSGFVAAPDPGLLRCRVGETYVAATPVNDSTLECTTPLAQPVGLSRRLVLGFHGAKLSPARELDLHHGTVHARAGSTSGRVPIPAAHSQVTWENESVAASLFADAEIFAGSLRLTRAIPGQLGGFSFSPPRLAGDEQGRFPTAFRLSLAIVIGTGFMHEPSVEERTAGEGMSISVGELPDAAAGELGSGNGLRVSLLTRGNELRVTYGARTLLSSALPHAARLRSNQTFPLVLSMQSGNLTIAVDDVVVMAKEPLLEWQADVRPSWRVGLGGRTNDRRGENHIVERLDWEVGPSLDASSARLEVTANGQQYSEDALQLGYFGQPLLSEVHPPLGPTHGGTRVVVRGIALHGGSAYRCRFGLRHVEAEYDAHQRTISCSSPPFNEAVGNAQGGHLVSAEAGRSISMANSSSNSSTNSSSNSSVANQSSNGSSANSSAGGANGHVTLAVSLNEQDAIPTTLPFVYYAHPEILAVSPSAGPVHGASRVVLVVGAVAAEGGTGTPWQLDALPNGTRPECRFGLSEAVPATLGGLSAADAYAPSAGAHAAGASAGLLDPSDANGSSHVNATDPAASLLHAAPAGHTLTCITPPTTAGRQTLYVSLNQHDYRPGGSSNFTFYERAVVSALVPSGGPRHGGTSVRVLGRGIVVPGGVSSHPALCRFGRQVVPATVDDEDSLSCTAPSSASAGAEIDAEIDVAEIDGSPLSPADELARATYNLELGGTARRMGDGLQLTMGPPGESGQATVTPPTVSSQLALGWFDARFETRNLGGDGLSLSVGDVPSEHVGSSGGGLGLRVVFTPDWRQLRVSYAAQVLQRVLLDEVTPTPSTAPADGPVEAYIDATGVTHTAVAGWHRVRVAYREDGLHVIVDGARVISGLHLRLWAPVVGWRLVLAASTSRGFGRHWLRGLWLRTDAAVHSATLAVAISLNGQQFEPALYAWPAYAHPTVLSVAPQSGPTHGGTRLLVDGLAFAAGASSHRCRFGDAAVVNATFQSTSGYLACISPAVESGANVSMPVNFSIGLERHGQLFWTDAAERLAFAYDGSALFDAHAKLALAPLPASGPVNGGTRISFDVGGILDRGSVRHCRFDLRGLRVEPRAVALAQMADAALLASIVGFNASRAELPALTVEASFTPGPAGNGGMLSCLSPAVNLTDAQRIAARGASLPVSLSLNGQQFTTPGSPLLLHAPPLLDLISPACGPVSGGTRLTVVGQQLWGGSNYRCRIGETTTFNATYVSTPQGDLLTCETPPSALAVPKGASRWPLPLAISLNAQQYDLVPGARVAPGTAAGFVPSGFELYAGLDEAAHVAPPSVPAMDGGLIGVYASSYYGGCAYACRFGDGQQAVTVPGTHNAADGGLRCHAPSGPAGEAVAIWITLNGQQFVLTGANLTWA